VEKSESENTIMIRGISPEIDKNIKGKVARQTRFIGLIWAVLALSVAILVFFSYNVKPKHLTREEKEVSASFEQGVVKVVSPTREWRGTGFLIAPDKVMTNTHVVKDLKEVDVFFFKQNQPIRGKVIASFYEEWLKRVQNNDPLSWEEDFAIVEIPSQQKSLVIPLGESRNLRDGEEMLLLGYHGGLDESVSEPQWTKGYLIEQNVMGASSRLMRVRVTANPGSSGSPVISIAQKAVVGLAFGVPIEEEVRGKVTYAIPIEHIKKIIFERKEIFSFP
jgi:S1-C subfamily serine protease